MYFWSPGLATDFRDLRNQEADADRNEMPIGVLLFAVVAVSALWKLGAPAVLPLVALATLGSIGAAFLVPGRSSSAEELEEERGGHQLLGFFFARLRSWASLTRARKSA